MKNTTIGRMYYFSLVSNAFMLICCFASIIVTLFNIKSISNNLGDLLGVLLVVAIVAVLVILVCFVTKDLIVLLKDLNAVKCYNYITITAKVIRFKRDVDPESGIQINNQPIVISIETNEKILLKVNENVRIGEIYKFNYLKNCKIAEIVRK